MARQYFMLACSLLSCLTAFCAEPPRSTLNSSTDKLRNSQGVLPRSQSEELSKLTKQAVAATVYYDFYGKFTPIYEKRELMPVQSRGDYRDCP